MSRSILFLVLSFIVFRTYSSDLIKYYNGELTLSVSQLDSLCQQILVSEPSNYLISLAHYQIAIAQRKHNYVFLAYESYDKALEYLAWADSSDSYLEFSIRRNQGVILKYYGFPKEAAGKHEEALSYAYSYKQEAGLSVKYNLGWCLAAYDSEHALRIFFEVLEEAEEAGLKDRQAKTYNEIGNMLIRSEEYIEAGKYFNKALDFSQTDHIRAQSYHNLSAVFYYLGDYATQESLLLQSLALRSEVERFPSLRDLGECYLKQKEYEKARTVLLEAEMYFASYPLIPDNIRVFEWLADTEPDSVKYWKRLATEFERLAAEQEKLEKLLKQQAMQQLLLRLEGEKKSKSQINLYRILTIAGGVLALAILLTWRIWWYRLRRQLGKKILKLVDKWEVEDKT
ncbi:MAG: tetratricopeptide repeat protein [Cyclobacteriaceae bacterium]